MRFYDYPTVALTLHPTRIEASPAFAGLEDWDVLDDGKPVGRIYEQHVPARPDLAWFWSITGLSTSGTTATLDEAKAAFRVVLMGGENRVGPDPIMREQLKCHCCGGLACNRYAQPPAVGEFADTFWGRAELAAERFHVDEPAAHARLAR